MTGEVITTGQGNVGRAAFVPLRSRKTGGGSSSRELSGQAISLQVGVVAKAVSRALAGSMIITAHGTLGGDLPGPQFSGAVLTERFLMPDPPNGFSGEGKHHVVQKKNGKYWFTGGDWVNIPDNGVAASPSVQDGRQDIWSFNPSNPEHVFTREQDYWPAAAATGGYLGWNIDDGGGVAIGGDEIMCFRSTGVISGDPGIGTFGYPGSPPVGTLIGTASNRKFAIYNVVTKAWREGPPIPSELTGNKSWGGVYDAANNEALFICQTRNVVRIRLSDGADLTPRVSGVMASLGASATFDSPLNASVFIPRGFIADGPSGEGPCVWIWDTGNHRLLTINLAKLRSWNGSSFTLGFPLSIVRSVPYENENGRTTWDDVLGGPYPGQANTTLTLDQDTGMICVWGLRQPGKLHMLSRANALTGDWTTVDRQDKVKNTEGKYHMCQRQIYDPELKKTFSFGLIDFTRAKNVPEHPYFFVKTSKPSWIPDYNTVAVISGASVPADVYPGPGPWDNNGAFSSNRMFDAWNAIFHNPWGPDEFGDLIVANAGGDIDGVFTGVLKLEQSASGCVWRRQVNPYGGFTHTGTGSTPPSNMNTTTMEFDGTFVQPSPHQYGNGVVLPKSMGGGTNGHICFPVGRFVWGNGYSSRLPCKIDLGVPIGTNAVDAWTRAGTSVGTFTFGDAVGNCIVDSKRKRLVFYKTGYGNLDINTAFTLTGWSGGMGNWNTQTFPTFSALGNAPSAMYWHEQDLVVFVGRTPSSTFGIQLHDLATGICYSPPIAGTLPYIGITEGYGLGFVPRLRAFYIQEVNNAVNKQKLWRLQPPEYAVDGSSVMTTASNPRTGTWVSTEVVMPGVTVNHYPRNGEWNLPYNQKADLLQWCHGINAPTYGYRPPAN